MNITLVRSATLILETAAGRLLVDPMLDPAGARPPIEDTANPVRNPTVGLPISRGAGSERTRRRPCNTLSQGSPRRHRGAPPAARPPRVLPARGRGAAARGQARRTAGRRVARVERAEPAPGARTAWPRRGRGGARTRQRLRARRPLPRRRHGLVRGSRADDRAVRPAGRGRQRRRRVVPRRRA